MKRILALISTAIIICLLLIPTGTALADQAYHSERLPVHSLDPSVYPLRNGIVVNIHTNGTTNFAVEEYNLNGAKPNATFWLCREFEESLLGLTAPWDALNTGFVLQTYKVGNGNCKIKFLVAQVEPLIAAGQTDLHVKFVFIEGGTPVEVYPGTGIYKIVGGTPAYATDVTEIQMDSKR
jgi:hypothetical protein